MALTERTVIDRLEVLRDGTVQVREAREVLRDGVVIATEYHRNVIHAADDDPDLSGMDLASADVVRAARTPARVVEARARRAELDPRPDRVG